MWEGKRDEREGEKEIFCMRGIEGRDDTELKREG